MEKIYKEVRSSELVVGNVYYDTPGSQGEAMEYVGCFTENSGEEMYLFLSCKKKSRYVAITKEGAKEIGIKYRAKLIPFSTDGIMYIKTYKNTEDE